MNYEAIRQIYLFVLRDKCSIKYHKGDRYTITSYREDGTKKYETDFLNGRFHGFMIEWGMDGFEMKKNRYDNGMFIEYCWLGNAK